MSLSAYRSATDHLLNIVVDHFQRRPLLQLGSTHIFSRCRHELCGRIPVIAIEQCEQSILIQRDFIPYGTLITVEPLVRADPERVQRVIEDVIAAHPESNSSNNGAQRPPGSPTIS